jgi:NDP-sugar pyrophosphorylase family protein
MKMKKRKRDSKVKVLLLAAGNATRCQPLSNLYNKPMLPIGDTPLIGRILRCFSNIGCNNFFIVFSKDDSPLVSYVKKFKAAHNISIRLIEQPNPMGMADAVLLAKDHLLPLLNGQNPEDSSFIITAGDVLFNPKMISQMIQFHFEKKAIATVGMFHSLDNLMGIRYANIHKKENNRILKIIEKPGRNNLISKYFSMPLFLFSKKMFPYLKQVPLSERGEREIQDAIQKAINARNPVFATPILSKSINSENEGRYHLTYPRDFLAMNWRYISEYASNFEKMDYSTIPPIAGKPLKIGRNCTLGPNVYLSSKVRIEKESTMSETYCFPNSHIHSHCSLSNCIVGENAIIPTNTHADSKIFLELGVFPFS